MARHEVTLVTGLLDLGRGRLAPTFQRSFEDYRRSFRQLLEMPVPIVAYVDPNLADFVRSARGDAPTHVVSTRLEDLEALGLFDAVQRIRTQRTWRAQAAWLEQSPQGQLPHYNPMVFSKLPWLAEQARANRFSTSHFAWIDAGITRTVSHEMLKRPDVGRALAARLERLLFLCYPYRGAAEIHGFPRAAMARLCQTPYVEWVARGGFFGGRRDYIETAARIYEALLEDSLGRGLMGTEESVLTILAHLHPGMTDRFVLEENGLVGPFFDSLSAGPS